MVSKQPFWPWGIASDEEKQVEDRVNHLETKIDELQSELQEQFGGMKFECQRAMSRMMEKLDWMIKKGMGKRRGRKKGL